MGGEGLSGYSNSFRPLAFLAALILAALACSRQPMPLPAGGAPAGHVTAVDSPLATAAPGLGVSADVVTATPIGIVIYPTVIVAGTPTPDPTRAPATAPGGGQHVVQAGDTLGKIAARYGVSIEALTQANGLTIDSLLSIGQVLIIPEVTGETGPPVKLIPDSELVHGPSTLGFDVERTVRAAGGYLAAYSETDGYGVTRTGAELLSDVALFYSVNPRLLLVLLEYQSNWVTNPNPPESTLAFPIGYQSPGTGGLERQLKWAANALNAGYYAWRENRIVSWDFPDGGVLRAAPGINAGTAAIQFFFSQLYNRSEWEISVTGGFTAAYQRLFGNPFAYAVEPLIPTGLRQPPLTLPWDPSRVWYFTGGPHGGWDSGSAWAALDFAPPAEVEGCVQSDEWVQAAADGLVVRSADGAVVQDLDGDGHEQTGWAIFYMHIETRHRAPAGARLRTGDIVGHPSCEGGFANGTHLHLARKYNGEWIAADGPIPFVLDAWTSAGAGREYDGWLVNGDVSVEACDCRDKLNEIQLDGGE